MDNLKDSPLFTAYCMLCSFCARWPPCPHCSQRSISPVTCMASSAGTSAQFQSNLSMVLDLDCPWAHVGKWEMAMRNRRRGICPSLSPSLPLSLSLPLCLSLSISLSLYICTYTHISYMRVHIIYVHITNSEHNNCVDCRATLFRRPPDGAELDTNVGENLQRTVPNRWTT